MPQRLDRAPLAGLDLDRRGFKEEDGAAIVEDAGRDGRLHGDGLTLGVEGPALADFPAAGGRRGESGRAGPNRGRELGEIARQELFGAVRAPQRQRRGVGVDAAQARRIEQPYRPAQGVPGLRVQLEFR
jgi:hypothetical protein